LPEGRQARRAAPAPGDGDLPAAVSPYATVAFLQELTAEAGLRDRAVAVLLKGWKAKPIYQMAVLSYLTSESVWQMPEVYDLVRSTILTPNPISLAISDQWEPFYTSGSRVIGGQTQAPPTPAERFLDLTAARGRLDDLASEIESAR